ncbi:hypothetical protein Glove_83g110 [Diversispora epigaea]|uniref:Protein kinase domain-containing protein n=1 Tax=Diversispora epigaea TaxID=1348612 RepID=A0A397JA09_9GLOM|nr:hypothetical protein Glove_83g110 [Diversispora epigaea]
MDIGQPFQLTKIPQLLIDSMKRCWDANPDQRPTTSELFDHFNNNLVFIPTPIDILNPKESAVFKRLSESEIYNQIKECDRLNSTNSSTSPEIQIHPSAIYTSRPLNLKNLPKPKNSNENLIKETVEIRWPNLKFMNQVLIVMTVPAEYSEQAYAIMRDCAYKAGLISTGNSEKLQFSTEPEAAAIHCMTVLKEHFLTDVGMNFLIVDCGGGIVDLTT